MLSTKTLLTIAFIYKQVYLFRMV